MLLQSIQYRHGFSFTLVYERDIRYVESSDGWKMKIYNLLKQVVGSL